MVVEHGRFVVLALFLGATLAGCIGDGEVKGPRVEGTPDAEAAVVTGETGSIKGQVITIDLMPVVREPVALIRSGNATPFMVTKTDLQGRFTFNGVPPDGYRIHIRPACCVETLSEVIVFAGSVSEVGLMLERLVILEPYMDEDEWSGFVACSVTGNDVCRLDANNEPIRNFNVSQGLLDLVVGMVWDPAGGISDSRLNLHVERNNGRELVGATGRSPILLQVNDTIIDRGEYKFENITEEGQKMRFRVSSPGLAITYQQAFTIYWRAYYHQPAPPGDNPIPDG